MCSESSANGCKTVIDIMIYQIRIYVDNVIELLMELVYWSKCLMMLLVWF